MVTQDELLEHIRSWAETSFRKSHMRTFSHFDESEAAAVIVSLLVVTDNPDDAYNTAYEDLRTRIKSTTSDWDVCRIESHSHSFLRLKCPKGRMCVILGCLSPSQIPKDENMGSFIDSTVTGLKPTRDAVLLRQLQLPRLYSWFGQWLGNIDTSKAESFQDALGMLIKWSISRGIFGDGFLTREIIIVMLVSITPSTPISSFELCKKFFRFYSSEFDMNESSVASHVSRLAGSPQDGLYGSMINEDEGIDSDVDDDLRRVRLDRKHPKHTEADDENIHSLLSTNANENDDVHPHKRLRFELGQIRDIRRFYAVENSILKKISALTSNQFDNFLDYLDVITVCHPGHDQTSVNLAVRVLESHKKLIVQELVRANMLVSDCVGDEVDKVYHLLTEKIADKKNCDIQIFCIFETETNDEEIREIVFSVVRDQVWFFVQEMQATHGVMVVPIAQGEHVSVGLIFVTDDPYSATEGAEIDLIGPISRVMLRAKKIIKERSDYAEIQGKFKVRSRVVRNEG
jgi:hypothetical protein